jgi:hypothetical protein
MLVAFAAFLTTVVWCPWDPLTLDGPMGIEEEAEWRARQLRFDRWIETGVISLFTGLLSAEALALIRKRDKKKLEGGGSNYSG